MNSYDLVINWDIVDKVYVVTVKTLPGCSTHGKTLKQALENAAEAIESYEES